MVERQALARMDHPAIAKVYDAGTTPQGHPFFAMEWIDGPSLGAYIGTHPLAVNELLELFIRVCMGVQHAHQRGVIHRDLKPSNVLIADVDGKPMPKIIDFGIAIGASRTTGGESTLMQSAGTRGYMSPEQLRGKINEIDVRSDIYALGVMLLELLMSSETMDHAVSEGVDNRGLHAALLASLGRKADARSEVVRGISRIPEEIRWALVRATEPERAKRYESAQAFADDLRRYLDRYPLRAVPADENVSAAVFRGAQSRADSGGVPYRRRLDRRIDGSCHRHGQCARSGDPRQSRSGEEPADVALSQRHPEQRPARGSARPRQDADAQDPRQRGGSGAEETGRTSLKCWRRSRARSATRIPA